MTIPFLDIQATYKELKPEIDAAVGRVLASGWYIGGPEVEAFETEWAAYCGAAHSVGVGNGMDALIMALRACDIGPGDEVIVPSHTFIATWLAVSSVGATLRPVEPEPNGYNIDPQKIAAAITSKTRAIIPVHLYGMPVDLDPILEVAQAHGLRVIEDAAQAHGARYKGTRIGAHGDIVCWSFYPGKNLGALGDGGAITTNDAELAQRVRQLGNYGSSQKYVHDIAGVNSRLDPVQAAVLRVKLARLDDWTVRRQKVATAYSARLSGSDFILPQTPNWADPVWHLYVVRNVDRDGVQARLAQQGIGSLVHYPIAPHMQKAYADLGYDEAAFPMARDMAGQVFSLPMGPHLLQEAVEQVCDVLLG